MSTDSSKPTSSTRDERLPRLVVAIGASAGGLDACKKFFALMPETSGFAFIVVMHLDPAHESHIAEILGATTGMPVAQVSGDQPLELDHVYVMAPDSTLQVRKGVLHPEKPHELQEKRKPIDSLFSSLAADQNRRAVAVVFSGAGDDGSSGILKVNAAGGRCIVQDPETALYDSMPRSALATGVVDHVLSPEQMPAVLLDFAERADGSGADPVAEPELAAFSSILETLGTRYGLAFGAYKKGTLKRRTERRMALRQATGWQQYLRTLRETPDEVEALYRDLLIGVTSFFRDTDVWEYIECEIIPALFASKCGDGPIRIWVPACATGEEAYSFAIVALEQLAGTRGAKLQIYATDVSEGAVATARRGAYPASIANDVSPERLRRFFRQEGGNFHVGPEVRDTVTFAVHNLLTAPPFSKLDLVSCRNLLIYLEPQAQDALLELFHFALRPGGVLVLGSSETVSRNTDLYDPLSKKHRVYRATSVTRFDRHRMPSWLDHRTNVNAPTQSARQTSGKTARLVEQFVLNRRTPACVAINRSFEVLYLFGPTHDYLVQPTGEVRLDLLSWVRPGLYPKLRGGLQAAVASGQPLRLTDMRVERNEESVRVDCSIEPITGVPGAEGLFLVVFRDSGSPTAVPSPAPADDVEKPSVRELEAELREARQELRSAVEQLDSTNAEYRASNEELVSLNEELQSSNEELESSKEELQSLNEEIATINRQLEERNAELRALNADLTNFLVSAGVPTIFLDRELRVRRFTPAATEVMRLVASDVGRSIEHIKERFHDELLLDDISQVLERLVPLTAELETEDGRWYLRKVLPYRSLDDRIDGVTITFGEITAQKRAAAELDEARLLSEAIVETVRTPLLVLDDGLRVVSANSCFLETFRASRAEVENRKLYELGHRQWDIRALRTLLGEVLPQSRAIDDYVVELDFEELGHRVMLLNARQMAPGDRPLILIAVEDVTHRYDSERVATRRSEELAEEHHRKDEFLAMLGHELRNPLSALTHGIELSGKVGDDRERSAELREMMARQAKRISTLLDELLDVARVVSGKIEIARDRVELTEVVRRAVETMTPFIESHEQKLTLELPAEEGIFALGDATRLSQVVENLLANAAKYSKPGGQIRLALEASAGEVRIAIRDTGVGIDPEFLPRLFDLFTQAPRQLSRSEGGLGLGLPLVRRLVELHGGHVVASSSGLGQGSEFVVTLPRLLETRSTEAVHVAEVRPRRILVVDDERDIAEALAELLEHEGHQVLAVYDGRAALDAVTTFKPEVVLLDLGLPRMDGYEVAKSLRETSGSEILLIALTGYNKDAARLEQAGFDRHLIKPPSIRKISELLSASPSR